MTPDELRQACLALPGAEETAPFSEGLSVFKVEGKIFAITRLEGVPLEVSLKCEPELAEQLRVTHPAIRPGYHLNKRHWNTVTIDGSVAGRDGALAGRGLVGAGGRRAPAARARAPHSGRSMTFAPLT